MSTSLNFEVHDVLAGPDYAPAGPSELVIEDGRIARISSLPQPPDGGRKRVLAMPALVNAHDHARPLSSTSFGGAGRPLETWLPRLAMMPAVDPYVAAVAAFGRAARGGCAGVMVHLTRPMGLMPLAEEAVLIAQAADEVGIAIGLAISMRDTHPLVYGDHAPVLEALPAETRAVVEATWLRPPPPIAAQLAAVDEVAAAVAGHCPGARVDVQYGPTGVQWCSRPLLEAIARGSAGTGRRVHMHFLETALQREWADQHFPDGIADYLATIGLLSPRLTLAHGTWSRPDEIARIADAGARIAVNPSSNLHLYSGIAPALDMQRAGVDVALGLDGCTLDEDDDGLREMRLFRLLNAGHGFAGGLSGTQVLKAVCDTGRQAVGMEPGGRIEVGGPADILLLDLDALDRDAIMQVDPRDYIFTRATAGHIEGLIAGGREIVRGGRLLTVDLDGVHEDLRNQYRSRMDKVGPVARAWDELEPALVAFNREFQGCC